MAKLEALLSWPTGPYLCCNLHSGLISDTMSCYFLSPHLSSPPAPRPPFHKHTKHATASVPLYCWEHSSNSYLIGSHTHFRSPLKYHLVRVLSLTSLYLSPLEHDCNDSKCFYRACHVLDISVSAILYVYSCIILATSWNKTIIISILQKRKLRHRELKSLA